MVAASLSFWIYFLDSLFSSPHPVFFFFLIPFKIFIYFWLPWVFTVAGRLSHCSTWGLLFVVMYGLVIAVAFLVVELWL